MPVLPFAPVVPPSAFGKTLFACLAWLKTDLFCTAGKSKADVAAAVAGGDVAAGRYASVRRIVAPIAATEHAGRA